jgi:hypothetical protein
MVIIPAAFLIANEIQIIGKLKKEEKNSDSTVD